MREVFVSVGAHNRLCVKHRYERGYEGLVTELGIGVDFVPIAPLTIAARDGAPTTTRHVCEIGPGGVGLALCMVILPRPHTYSRTT